MSNKQTNPEISKMRRKSMEINLLEKAKKSDFLCDFRFRNELPDPSAKVKLMALNRDPDRYCKYQPTSLEKNWRNWPPLHVEPDLGIPLDLLDLSVFNRPKGKMIPLDPEDEELLRDDEDDDDNMDSTNQSLTEKPAEDLRESHGRDVLKNLSTREQQMEMIEASFEAMKHPLVNKDNPQLKPLRILPLHPDFVWYNDQFVTAMFDTDPFAGSENNSRVYAAEHREHGHEKLVARDGGSTCSTSGRGSVDGGAGGSGRDIEGDKFSGAGDYMSD